MKTQKGFSLIEILFVVVIMAVLVAIAITQYQTAVDKSRFTALIPTAKALANAQEIYHLNHGTYTNDMSRLDVNMEGASGDEAILSSGAIVEIGLDDEYRYVKATRDNLDNNYIIYQSYSQNYPGEIHCEALEGSSRAEKVCKNMGGREISGNLTEGYTTYILRGEGNGIPASVAHEMGEGNFQTCESYPCNKVCARNLPDNYECQGTYNEDHSYSEQVCNNGMCVTTSYDSNGKMVSKTLCKQDQEAGVCKEVTRTTWDGEGHLLEQNRNCFAYSEDGTCKFFRTTLTYTYDEQGNLLSTDSSSINNWEAYDKDGRIISSSQWGTATEYIYDEDGRLISKVGPYGNTTTYTYDEEGHLISATNQYGSTDSYTYDENGRLATTHTQYGSTITYAYDSEGRVISETNQNGTVLASYTYDENGRLISKTEGNNTYTYTYDDAGHLIAETDKYGNTTATHTYDENGQLTNSWGRWAQYGCNVSYTYDADGGYVSGVSNSRSIHNTYDEEGYLVSSTMPDGSVTTYDRNGNKINSTTTYGYTTTYNYDDSGNLTSQVSTNSSGTTSSSTTYTYDDKGNQTSQVYQSGTYSYSYTYTYDEDGNMTSSTYRSGNGTPTTTTYTYDEHGNMTSSQYGNNKPSTYNYTYDENGKMTSVTSSGGSSYTYTYDSNGNLTSYNFLDSNGNVYSSYTYAYDEGGNLISNSYQSNWGSYTNYFLNGEATMNISQTGCVTVSYSGNIGSLL